MAQREKFRNESDSMSIEERGFLQIVAHLRALVSAFPRLYAVFFPVSLLVFQKIS
jgi:hypothetical protein